MMPTSEQLRLSYSPSVLRGNVLWADGRVTASYVVPTVNVEHPTEGFGLAVRDSWAELYQVLLGKFGHHTVRRQVPVSEVVRREVACLPGDPRKLGEHRGWMVHIAQAVETVIALPQIPVESYSVLTVDLGIRGEGREGVLGFLSSAVSRREDGPPTARELERAAALEAALHNRIVSLMDGSRRMEDWELRWWVGFSLSFGGAEVPYSHPAFQRVSDSSSVLSPLGSAELNRAAPTKFLTIEGPLVVDPFLAGHPSVADEDSDDPLIRALGEVRSMVRVPEEEKWRLESGRQETFTAVLAVSSLATDWLYPDHSLWAQCLDLPFTVRMSVLGEVVPNRKARRKVSGAVKENAYLAGQNQNETVHDYERTYASEQQQEILARLSRDGVPMTPATVLITVAAPDEAILEDRVQAVIDKVDAAQIHFVRADGRHTEFWAATLPGGPVSADVRSFQRDLLASDLASLAAFHDRELGDPNGRLFGIVEETEGAPPELVFRNACYGLADKNGNRGATSAHIGDSGAGKTTVMKEDAWNTIAVGGKAFVMDSTPTAEWLLWAQALISEGYEVVVVEPAGGEVVCDLLRVMTLRLPAAPDRRRAALAEAHRRTLGFLSIELNIEHSDDDRYYLLSSALQSLLSDDLPMLAPSLPNLLLVLRHWANEVPEADRLVNDENAQIPELAVRQGAEFDAAVRLCGRLSVLSKSPVLGASLFGDGPVLDLAARCVIFCVRGAQYEGRDSEGVLYLGSALGLGAMMLQDALRYFAMAEVKEIAANPHGAAMVETTLTMGRRLGVGVGMDGQVGRHIPSADLVVNRTVGRSETEQSSAAVNLEFVRAPVTASRIARLKKFPNGKRFIGDSQGRVGIVRAFQIMDPVRRELSRTDPQYGPDGHKLTEDELKERAFAMADDRSLAVSEVGSGERS